MIVYIYIVMIVMKISLWVSNMKLIYKCRLCGQTFERHSDWTKHTDVLLDEMYRYATHECIENKQYGLSELIGVKK